MTLPKTPPAAFALTLSLAFTAGDMVTLGNSDDTSSLTGVFWAWVQSRG